MIGDVLVSSLLCEHIKAHLPNSEVHYLIEEHTTAVVENNPFVDKIILFKEDYKNSRSSFYTFLKSIRAESYDVVVDVYGKLESNLITYFSKAKIKVAYSKWRSKFLYTHHVPIKSRQPGSSFTTIDDRLGLLSPIISERLDVEKMPKVYLTQSEIDEAKNFLKTQGINSENPLIMLGVLGSGDSKTYPLKYMGEVIDTIAAETYATLLFNYIPSQEKDARKVYEMCDDTTKQKISFETFAPNLRKFLALLSFCDCYIGNEGGSTNMAKALGVPTFSIFAPWIDKFGWSTYADDKNISVHVADYFPEKFENISKKQIKSNIDKLYHLFEPKKFHEKLSAFLNREVFSDQ